ncbi:pyridoxal-dependent decarboxylase, exosortase A system-associated [Aliikangiella maris]|uniref:Pyridoxal-dependent decarboxylase, exosortase A system-associated n=2 Tax=Aliikangiella maris TaxID=3162458 RepID=A0ABV3MSQ6_9GAMM
MNLTTKAKPQHAPMDQFKVHNNWLMVNGVSLERVKLRAGQTPFYAYDRSVISHKIAQLRQYMPQSLKLHYAMKANPMPAVVSFLNSQVDGIDVASGNELLVALNSGIAGHQISFAGPGKQSQELTMAIASSVTINVESFNELSNIARISDATGISAKVAVRVNPDFELKSSGMKMGGGPQQFGIDAEQVPKALLQIEALGLDYQGLHIFSGSQNLNQHAIMQTHRQIFELASRLQRSTNLELLTLNIGGGLGIPYFPGEMPLDIAPIGQALAELIDNLQAAHPNVEVAMELGRYIVGEAGIYVCEVVDIKESRGTRFAIVNGGLHHHLSASGNFGQVIRKNYPVAIGNKMISKKQSSDIAQNNTRLDQSVSQEKVSAEQLYPVQIVGPLCTPLDLLADKYELPAVEIGDLVVVYQSGAYGFTASPRDFLSHPQPVELLI